MDGRRMSVHNGGRLAVLLVLAAACAPAAAITFHLINNDSPGEGFNDPALGPVRLTAFQYALDVWGMQLWDAYPGETIDVEATMDPMGGSSTSAILGQAGAVYIHRDFASSNPKYQTSTWYGSPLADHLAGSNLTPGEAHVSAAFNSDVDNPVVLGSMDWYYGIDGQCGSDIDFVTVVLHEVGHGLNFFDTINPSNGSFSYQSLPGIYDRFLIRGATGGTALTALSRNQRKTALTSNNVYWSGPEGIAKNGGVRPKLYAPNPYESGSSISHLDETAYPADLMSPYYSAADHDPSGMDLGMLSDMGWDIRIPGDANGDGIVDLQDFGILKDHFGEAGAWADGDFNGDGIVDLQDFGILKQYFGESYALTAAENPAASAGFAASGASAIAPGPQLPYPLGNPAVPEPASAILIAAAAMGLAWRKRNR